MEDFLSPRDLAAAIGVSESSLKRWVDGGQLQAARTAGGHRRIAVSEAVRFIRASGTQVVRPELLGFPGMRPWRGAAAAEGAGAVLFEALVADDRQVARSLIVSSFLAGAPLAAVCDGPMRYALERIGDMWRHDERGILIEHRAVDTCLQALSLIRGALRPPPPESMVAVGGAPASDPYWLPSLMAAAVLADAGFRDVNLGAAVPLATLRRAVGEYRPALVWLAVSVPLEPAALRKMVAALQDELGGAGEVVVGGRGVAPAALRGLARAHAMGSMAELAAFARGLRRAAGERS